VGSTFDIVALDDIAENLSDQLKDTMYALRTLLTEIPFMLESRLLSIRCYNAEAMMVVAIVMDGVKLKDTLFELIQNALINYIHIHFAIPGCYCCFVKIY